MRITVIHKNVLLRFFLLAAFCLGFPLAVNAEVSGLCSTCHTMHNSQGNNTLVLAGDVDNRVAWTDGSLTTASGTSGTDPQPHLLVTDCVGCHSSTGTATTVDMDGSGNMVPIVWNIGGGHTWANELAGGNFSHVEKLTGDQGKGHNVLGISDDDTAHAIAPGGGVGCLVSCHVDLTLTAAASTNSSPHERMATGSGCEGCHLWTGHHAKPGDDDPRTSAVDKGFGDAYRFLGGHGNMGRVDNAGGSYEGSGYLAVGAEGVANDYLGNSDIGTLNPPVDPLPFGRFCAGCHSDFHAVGADYDFATQAMNGGDRDADRTNNHWLRHPVDVALQDAGELAVVNDGVIGKPYDKYPLGRLAAAGFNNTVAVRADDQILCITCHKAHASQYPDSLRFDYTTMTAHSTATNDNTEGCFWCHRTKDNVTP